MTIPYSTQLQKVYNPCSIANFSEKPKPSVQEDHSSTKAAIVQEHFKDKFLSKLRDQGKLDSKNELSEELIHNHPAPFLKKQPLISTFNLLTAPITHVGRGNAFTAKYMLIELYEYILKEAGQNAEFASFIENMWIYGSKAPKLCEEQFRDILKEIGIKVSKEELGELLKGFMPTDNDFCIEIKEPESWELAEKALCFFRDLCVKFIAERIEDKQQRGPEELQHVVRNTGFTTFTDPPIFNTENRSFNLGFMDQSGVDIDLVIFERVSRKCFFKKDMRFSIIDFVKRWIALKDKLKKAGEEDSNLVKAACQALSNEIEEGHFNPEIKLQGYFGNVYQPLFELLSGGLKIHDTKVVDDNGWSVMLWNYLKDRRSFQPGLENELFAKLKAALKNYLKGVRLQGPLMKILDELKRQGAGESKLFANIAGYWLVKIFGHDPKKSIALAFQGCLSFQQNGSQNDIGELWSSIFSNPLQITKQEILNAINSVGGIWGQVRKIMDKKSSVLTFEAILALLEVKSYLYMSCQEAKDASNGQKSEGITGKENFYALPIMHNEEPAIQVNLDGVPILLPFDPVNAFKRLNTSWEKISQAGDQETLEALKVLDAMLQLKTPFAGKDASIIGRNLKTLGLNIAELKALAETQLFDSKRSLRAIDSPCQKIVAEWHLACHVQESTVNSAAMVKTYLPHLLAICTDPLERERYLDGVEKEAGEQDIKIFTSLRKEINDAKNSVPMNLLWAMSLANSREAEQGFEAFRLWNQESAESKKQHRSYGKRLASELSHSRPDLAFKIFNDLIDNLPHGEWEGLLTSICAKSAATERYPIKEDDLFPVASKLKGMLSGEDATADSKSFTSAIIANHPELAEKLFYLALAHIPVREISAIFEESLTQFTIQTEDAQQHAALSIVHSLPRLQHLSEEQKQLLRSSCKNIFLSLIRSGYPQTVYSLFMELRKKELHLEIDDDILKCYLEAAESLRQGSSKDTDKLQEIHHWLQAIYGKLSTAKISNENVQLQSNVFVNLAKDFLSSKKYQEAKACLGRLSKQASQEWQKELVPAFIEEAKKVSSQDASLGLSLWECLPTNHAEYADQIFHEVSKLLLNGSRISDEERAEHFSTNASLLQHKGDRSCLPDVSKLVIKLLASSSPESINSVVKLMSAFRPIGVSSWTALFKKIEKSKNAKSHSQSSWKAFLPCLTQQGSFTGTPQEVGEACLAAVQSIEKHSPSAVFEAIKHQSHLLIQLDGTENQKTRQIVIQLLYNKAIALLKDPAICKQYGELIVVKRQELAKAFNIPIGKSNSLKEADKSLSSMITTNPLLKISVAKAHAEAGNVQDTARTTEQFLKSSLNKEEQKSLAELVLLLIGKLDTDNCSLATPIFQNPSLVEVLKYLPKESFETLKTFQRKISMTTRENRDVFTASLRASLALISLSEVSSREGFITDILLKKFFISPFLQAMMKDQELAISLTNCFEIIVDVVKHNETDLYDLLLKFKGSGLTPKITREVAQLYDGLFRQLSANSLGDRKKILELNNSFDGLQALLPTELKELPLGFQLCQKFDQVEQELQNSISPDVFKLLTEFIKEASKHQGSDWAKKYVSENFSKVFTEIAPKVDVEQINFFAQHTAFLKENAPKPILDETIIKLLDKICDSGKSITFLFPEGDRRFERLQGKSAELFLARFLASKIINISKLLPFLDGVSNFPDAKWKKIFDIVLESKEHEHSINLFEKNFALLRKNVPSLLKDALVDLADQVVDSRAINSLSFQLTERDLESEQAHEKATEQIASKFIANKVSGIAKLLPMLCQLSEFPAASWNKVFDMGVKLHDSELSAKLWNTFCNLEKEKRLHSAPTERILCWQHILKINLDIKDGLVAILNDPANLIDALEHCEAAEYDRLLTLRDLFSSSAVVIHGFTDPQQALTKLLNFKEKVQKYWQVNEPTLEKKDTNLCNNLKNIVDIALILACVKAGNQEQFEQGYANFKTVMNEQKKASWYVILCRWINDLLSIDNEERKSMLIPLIFPNFFVQMSQRILSEHESYSETLNGLIQSLCEHISISDVFGILDALEKQKGSALVDSSIVKYLLEKYTILTEDQKKRLDKDVERVKTRVLEECSFIDSVLTDLDEATEGNCKDLIKQRKNFIEAIIESTVLISKDQNIAVKYFEKTYERLIDIFQLGDYPAFSDLYQRCMNQLCFAKEAELHHETRAVTPMQGRGNHRRNEQDNHSDKTSILDELKRLEDQYRILFLKKFLDRSLLEEEIFNERSNFFKIQFFSLLDSLDDNKKQEILSLLDQFIFFSIPPHFNAEAHKKHFQHAVEMTKIAYEKELFHFHPKKLFQFAHLLSLDIQPNLTPNQIIEAFREMFDRLTSRKAEGLLIARRLLKIGRPKVIDNQPDVYKECWIILITATFALRDSSAITELLNDLFSYHNDRDNPLIKLNKSDAWQVAAKSICTIALYEILKLRAADVLCIRNAAQFLTKALYHHCFEKDYGLFLMFVESLVQRVEQCKDQEFREASTEISELLLLIDPQCPLTQDEARERQEKVQSWQKTLQKRGFSKEAEEFMARAKKQ